jgi:D-glucosaminate-6-phosphate ammonia-lyase
MIDAEADRRLMEGFGLRPVINAAGYPSRLGGGHLAPAVVDAMAAAARTFVPIAEMQAKASELIAELVGAEAGCVASGADACLTIAAAACITGADLAAMDRLPDTTGLRNEIVVHRAHRNAFDHALRVAGARFVEFGYLGPASGVGAYKWQMDAAFSERTAAAFYVDMPASSVIEFKSFVEIAHSHGVPVIVDAAPTPLPPANLRRWIELGADLVAYAGGKFIGGPAASGFLAGRRDLVRAATMQQQDAFVHPAVFVPPFSEGSNTLHEPPHQGLGRVLKVGREEIAGLMAALGLIASRDFETEKQTRERVSATLAAAARACGVAGVNVVYDEATSAVTIFFANAQQAAHVAKAMEDGTPRVFVQNTRISERAIRMMPHCVREHEVEPMAVRLRACLLSLPAAQ